MFISLILKVNSYTFIFILAAFFVIEVLLSLMMVVAAIVSSAISCRAICCRRSKAQGSVLYNPVGIDGQPIPLQQVVPLSHGGVQVPISGAANSGCEFKKHFLSIIVFF